MRPALPERLSISNRCAPSESLPRFPVALGEWTNTWSLRLASNLSAPGATHGPATQPVLTGLAP